MRKDDLVRALVSASKTKPGKAASRSAKRSPGRKKAAPAAQRSSAKRAPASSAGKSGRTKASANKKEAKPKSARTVRKIQRANEARSRRKDLATTTGEGNGQKKKKDRVVLLVRDAYWLQVLWELRRESVERARAAMAEHWHTARPILRVMQLDSKGTTSTAERVVREIEIHGGVTTWYIDVLDSPKSFRVDIGYLSSNGKFFSVARSNAVTTPRPGNGDSMDQNWSEIAENCEKIYALSGGYSDGGGPRELQEMFEERLGRPVGSPPAARYGVGADKMLHREREFQFEVDAEMIIYGTAKADAHVTLAGTPVKLGPDGSFSARLSMPDRRQVLPVVASSGDGVEQRTVVLAIERNTKVMEPMIREGND